MKKFFIPFIILTLLFVGLAIYFLYQSLSYQSSKSLIEPFVAQEKESYYELLKNNMQSGGPPKDGIPAIDNPVYISAEEADQWLLLNDVVFGLNVNNFVAAYPQRILVWHEVLNEKINGENIAITYCPLTGTAIGYRGNFGVSGKLINSNLVMYDRTSDSYWPQILGEAILGLGKGSVLKEAPIIWTTWAKWKAKYPQTKVLSNKTGFLRDYSVSGDPYGSYVQENKGYYGSDSIIFDLTNEDERLEPKTVIIGLRDEKGNSAAISKSYLRDNKSVKTRLGEKEVVVTYDESLDSFTTTPNVSAFDAMWFAWSAFYPKTELIK